MTHINRIAGVQGSYVDETGTHLLLSLQPGASPDKVVGAVALVLKQHAPDRIVVQLSPTAAAETLTREWQDVAAVSQRPTTDDGLAPARAALRSAAQERAGGSQGSQASWQEGFLLALVALALALLAWWGRRTVKKQGPG